MELIKEIIRNGDTELDVYGVGYPTHKVVEINASGNDRSKTAEMQKAITGSKGVTIDNLARHSAVRDLEKRIGRMEENHISLIAYLSSFHGLDINEWNDWNNNTRMLPDKAVSYTHLTLPTILLV